MFFLFLIFKNFLKKKNFFFFFLNTQKKRRTSYFKNLRDSYYILSGFLKKENEAEKSETIQKLEEILRLHSMDTEDLIHEYFLEKHRATKEIQEEPEGTLAVKLIFLNDVLKIDILNASNIRAMDSNGGCLNTILYSATLLRVKILKS